MKRFLKKHSTLMLSIMGSVGVIGTAILAVKATPKAMKIIEDQKIEYERELTKMELIKVSWKYYIPSFVVGVTTIGCVFGIYNVSKKNQASLICAYSLLEQSFKAYREKINDIYGEDADRNVTKHLVKDQDLQLELSDEDDLELFYDIFSSRYFESRLSDVYKAEYEINRLYSKYKRVSLNDFYDLLKIDGIKGGNALGWSIEASESLYGYDSIEFEHELFEIEDDMGNIMECHALVMLDNPSVDYM